MSTSANRRLVFSKVLAPGLWLLCYPVVACKLISNLLDRSRELSRFKISSIFKFVQGTIMCTPLKSSRYRHYISSLSPNPLSTITSFINPTVHSISTHNIPHNLSLVCSITSIFSTQFSIYVSIANTFLIVVYHSQNPFSSQSSLFSLQNSFFCS